MRRYIKSISLLIYCIPIIIGSCASLKQSEPSGDESRGLSRETGRAFLVETQIEEPRYGLYSYLLFGSPPSNDIVRERYMQVITAYKNMVVDITALEKYIPRQELNITYLPLDLPPPSNPSVEWIFEHYNYARARALLRNLRGSLRDGPYIISTLKPLSATQNPPEKYLFQDMSSVQPHLISSWVKEFINQAAKERSWNEEKTMHFVLKLRSAIGLGAEAWSEVEKAVLKEKIAWLGN
jgi:hypothetical protein